MMSTREVLAETGPFATVMLSALQLVNLQLKLYEFQKWKDHVLLSQNVNFQMNITRDREVMTICKLENSVLSYTSQKCLPSSEIFHNLVLQKEVRFLFL